MTTSRDTRPTLNTTEVAELFGITRVTIYRWIKKGKIPEPMTDPVSKQKMWRQTDLEAVGQYMEKVRRGFPE